MPQLALDHWVIAYDLRGHGETALGRADGSPEQLATDLVSLLDVLELERADLVGFSLGGTVVLRAAIDHPRRVRRLVPVATSSRVGRAAVAWYRERAALAERGSAALHPVLRDDTARQLEGAPDELEAHWRIRQQSTADPAGFANGCRAMVRLGAEPLDPHLSEIRAPTLVVAAALDPLCPPRAGEIIAAGVPGARLTVIPGCGHQVPIEKPAELSRAILEFLEAAAATDPPAS